jgi:hypothetical protein
MNRLLLSLFLAVFGLCGCAQHYVLRLTNGYRVDAFGKPKLRHDYYHYKDGQGVEHLLPSGRVAEIGPASMMKAEQAPAQPVKRLKHRHWYLLWLAGGNRKVGSPRVWSA